MAFTNPKDRAEAEAEAARLAQPVTLTMEQLQLLIKTAQGGNTGNVDIAKAITAGMQQVKEPIPENKRSPEISVFNPLGDRDFPRPGFKCEL